MRLALLSVWHTIHGGIVEYQVRRQHSKKSEFQLVNDGAGYFPAWGKP